MRSNTLDYATLRAIVTEATENGLMVCLSAKTLACLIDKAEDSELTSVLPTFVSNESSGEQGGKLTADA
jgi:hypothetical protein